MARRVKFRDGDDGAQPSEFEESQRARAGLARMQNICRSDELPEAKTKTKSQAWHAHSGVYNRTALPHRFRKPMTYVCEPL